MASGTRQGAVRSAPELYAHALAVEREAATRYREFAQRMADLGNDGIAEVFRRFGAEEAEHLRILKRRTKGVRMPRLRAGRHHWLDEGGPAGAARDFVLRLMTPRMALQIALGAERRAEDFFEQVRAEAADPALRLLAEEMEAEERAHIAAVERLIERTPAGDVDWEAAFTDRPPAAAGR